ncbi:hypothetical protein [Micromonospora sp. NBC_01813]|uniref:hypothetical protein n=1 Tax=Micromonospora sp. NBC_01813 TaxID=2975988 RepID=UPI002DD8F26B|nr:hypothetical protein [Micromonospora sp. NBC_01813]WSA10442.1 hypothetical protein OG958_06535 [Micromonospora sp. NBC_01813]
MGSDDEDGGGDTVGGPDDNVTSGEDDDGTVEPAATGDTDSGVAQTGDELAEEPTGPW